MIPPLHHAATPAAAREAKRLAEFRELRARGALCTTVTEQMAMDAAEGFLEAAQATGEYLADAVTLLAEIGTLEEPCLSEPGQRATFPLLVEQLSDSFDPQACHLYDRAFAQMIFICRALPAGRELDAGLRRFGLQTESDLLARKERLRRRGPWRDTAAQRDVRKVLVLSRVTLGADVAVTSVVLQKAQALFLAAERVLLGPSKLHELFGGDASLRIRGIAYPPGGTLLERLLSWQDVLAAVEEETRGLQLQEYVLLDPDSRLLQLGMLPALAEGSGYFFFESRRYGATSERSISELTLDWLNETLGGEDRFLPHVWLREQDAVMGDRMCRKLRASGAQPVIAVSLGVGGNESKRIQDRFEERLLLGLLQEGCTVLLDKGTGEGELARANRLATAVQKRGWPVEHADATSVLALLARNDALDCRLLTWQGEIGAWSGLIAASDQFIGYDSAGQHIAAALGVPTIDIFTRSAAPLFRQRWHPTGPGVAHIVVEEGGKEAAANEVLERVMQAHRENRSERGRA